MNATYFLHAISTYYVQRFGGHLGVFIYTSRDIEIGEELTYDYRVVSESAHNFAGSLSLFCHEPELDSLQGWRPRTPAIISLQSALDCARLIVKSLPKIVLVLIDDSREEVLCGTSKYFSLIKSSQFSNS